MNWRHLFDAARNLAGIANGVPAGSGRPRQVDLRRAVSTAYYGMFHALCGSNADTLVGAAPPMQGTNPWVHAYRALEHGLAKERLGQYQSNSNMPADIRIFGNLQSSVMTLRPKKGINTTGSSQADRSSWESVRTRRACGKRTGCIWTTWARTPGLLASAELADFAELSGQCFQPTAGDGAAVADLRQGVLNARMRSARLRSQAAVVVVLTNPRLLASYGSRRRVHCTDSNELFSAPLVLGRIPRALE